MVRDLEGAVQTSDIVALSSRVGLTPSEWLALTTQGIEPPTAEEFREALMSTVVDD